MKIALAADHAGYELKQHVGAYLREQEIEFIELGANNGNNSVDYPDVVQEVAEMIISGKVERAVIVCGSGVGATMASNKITGIYAGLCHDTYSAGQGVEHDNMNVICMGARIIGTEIAREIIRAFLNAKFDGEENHVRRFHKMQAIERRV